MVGWASDVGFGFLFEGNLRVSAAEESIVGSVLGILTLETYGNGLISGDRVVGFRVKDAYVVVGDENNFTVGYLDPEVSSLADFDDDLPFTLSGTLLGGNDGLVPLTAGPLGGLSVQYRSKIAPGLVAGFGLENILPYQSTPSAFIFPNPNPPAPPPVTFVGVVSYESGAITGHVTSTMSGLFDKTPKVSIHAALTADFGTFGAMAAGTADSEGLWDSVMSVYAMLGPAEAAIDVTSTYLFGDTVDASIEYHITDAYSAGIERRQAFSDDPNYYFVQNTLFVEAEPLEGLTLSAELGEYETSYVGNGPIYFLRSKGTYRTDDLEIVGSYQQNSVGGSQYDITVSRALVH